MNLKNGYIKSCQICSNKKIINIINLGNISPCDTLLSYNDLIKAEKSFPLNLCRCNKCGLVQIDYVVDPKYLFHPNYPYKSGITKDLKVNLNNISNHVSKTHKTNGNLVIDIGSNDGSILEGFKKIGYTVLGVEPTNIAKIANKRGIPTIQKFFSLKLSNYIKKKHGKASIITASNVFAHVNKLSDLLNGIYNLLEDEGVFISESHYLVDIVEKLQFDSIYHEHLKYYSIKPLIFLLDKHNLVLVKVERISNYGGSIRAYVRKKKSKFKVHKSVKNLLNYEKNNGFYSAKIYKEFSKKVIKFRSDFKNLIFQLKRNNKKLIGIGCPGRAMTLLEYCGINKESMSYIIEQKKSLKIGLYTPGTHIPVLNEKIAIEKQPDYAVMLSWHYSKSIINNLRKKGLKSKIIIPLPKIKIVN